VSSDKLRQYLKIRRSKSSNFFLFFLVSKYKRMRTWKVLNVDGADVIMLLMWIVDYVRDTMMM
jgi:hypothetical protein